MEMPVLPEVQDWSFSSDVDHAQEQAEQLPVLPPAEAPAQQTGPSYSARQDVSQVLPFAPVAEVPANSMPPLPPGAIFPYAPAPLAQFSEPAQVPSMASGHVLGVVTIAVGVGAAVGIYYGGPFGGVAGSLFGGAVANAYKAAASYRLGTPQGDSEAKVSATYAVIAAGLATWVSYKLAKPRARFERNPEESSGGGAKPPASAVQVREEGARRGPCRPRSAYPVVAKACEEKP